MAIKSVNPATEEVLATYDEMSDAEVDKALADTQEAYRNVRKCRRAARAR